ncbi:MAG: PDZ domain-containing protein [Candidatus Aureabacteria bacterium]|nr:PDZ domain-containing protein [Candidatus Auribacterota bacterium]
MRKICIVFAVLFFATAVLAEEKKVAVLPFENLTRDESLDWLKSAISETLTTKFINAGIPTLERMNIQKILEEIHFTQRKDLADETTAIEAGKLHGAALLVLGAFQRSGDFIRITARFVDTESGEISKAVEETGLIEGLGLFQIQDKVAYSLIREKGGKIEQKGSVNLIDSPVYDQIVRLIKENYIHEIAINTSKAPDVEDLINQLDPYSMHLTKEQYDEVMTETSGSFAGIGVEIQVKEGVLTVVTPIDGTPAFHAGLKSGDRIMQIDGVSTEGMTLPQAVKRLRGEPGTRVTLNIERDNEEKTRIVTLVRSQIKITSVHQPRMLDRRAGYVRLSMFSTITPEELKQTLSALKKKGMKALVLDLRNNPGGLLASSVGVAELFLPKGCMIAKTKSRVKNMQMLFASQKEKYFGGPIAVLINNGTAAGAEILAAALRDNGRAILLGEKTYGKGTISSIYPLEDGSALRLTTTYYITPLGNVFEKAGIVPDIEMEKDEEILERAVETLKKR